MKRNILIIAALSLGAVVLSACETPTPYQPLNKSAVEAGGYTEAKIEGDRWRVTFQGNGLTSRQTVEDYLLYRAAELTLAQGFDWFETADRATDKHVSAYVTPDPWGYGYGWRPYWRFYGRAGWWGPRRGDPFFDGWGPEDVQTVERYEASAEIVMGRGPKPADDKHAFDAHEVTKNLADRIVRPKAS